MQFLLDSGHLASSTKMSAYSSLLKKLSILNISQAEKSHLIRILCQSIASDCPEKQQKNEDVALVSMLSKAITSFSPEGQLVSRKGYQWRGYLPCFNEERIQSLKKESNQLRKFATHATKHLLLEGAPIASELLVNKDVVNCICKQICCDVKLKPSSTFYHWYDSPSHRVEPHVDIPEFGLSVLMLLSHNHKTENRKSSFFVYPPGATAQKINLAIGEAIILFSGSVVHARSAPAPGETVSTVSWGFKII